MGWVAHLHCRKALAVMSLPYNVPHFGCRTLVYRWQQMLLPVLQISQNTYIPGTSGYFIKKFAFNSNMCMTSKWYDTYIPIHWQDTSDLLLRFHITYGIYFSMLKWTFYISMIDIFSMHSGLQHGIHFMYYIYVVSKAIMLARGFPLLRFIPLFHVNLIHNVITNGLWTIKVLTHGWHSHSTLLFF